MTARMLLAAALVISSCSGTATVGSTPPQLATEAEMETFCTRYEEVKNQSDKWRELEKVAPNEIKGQLIRLANGPSENYWQDREVVEEFEQRCEPLSD